MITRILLAVIVALHGVPVAALASAFHCEPCVTAVPEVREGDHCARKSASKVHPCAHHRDGHRSKPAGRGEPGLYDAHCSCRQTSAAAPSTSDPLTRPIRFELRVTDSARAMTVSALHGDPIDLPGPPSPPPRSPLS